MVCWYLPGTRTGIFGMAVVAQQVKASLGTAALHPYTHHGAGQVQPLPFRCSHLPLPILEAASDSSRT